MVPFNDYDQDPFLFSFNFKNLIGNPSEVNKSPNLHKKAKPWRILVVVVKWRHRANGLIKLTKISPWKHLTLLSRSTKKQGNQSFRPEHCNMRTQSALPVRSSESRDRHKIVKIRSQKKGLRSVLRLQVRKRRSLDTIWCLRSPSITGKMTNPFLPSPPSYSSLQFLLSTFNPCFHPLLPPHPSSALTKEFFEHFEQQFFSKWLQNFISREP